MLHQMLFHKHLEEDEHMVLIVHRHWLFGVRGLLLPTLLFVLSLAALLPYHTRGAMVILGCTVLISAVWVVHNFLDYFLDAWLVTDHGVIDLEWMGWFHRQSSRILYSDIQGVSYEIHGVLGTLLRYGTVAVEKISTGSAVSLANVSHPRRVESTILACMETYLHSKNLKNAKHIEELLSKFVAEHINEDAVRSGRGAAPAVKQSASSRPSKRSFSSSRVGGSQS